VNSKNDSTAKFLPDPASIRQEIVSLASGSKTLDLAVAFIGPEWQRLLGNYLGPLRLMCWLTHPGTDPDAVRSLMMRKDTFVMQRTGLHTKVYLAPGVGAIVGSANLSQSALTDRGGLSQGEAAVSVSDQQLVKEIGNWFDMLWNDLPRTKAISHADLERAEKERKKWPLPVANTINSIPPLPEPMPKAITDLAKKAQGLNLMDEYCEYHNQLSELIAKPRLNRSEISQLADLIASWTGHRAVYKTFEMQPPAAILQGLRTLLDEGRDIYDRLHEIREKSLLRGFHIPSMSLLLYWYRPDAYPPFNAKTKRFLKDFKMASPGMSASSPACYSTWLGFADLMRVRLQLPTVGHVDRIVSCYYESLKHEDTD
jgi:PLD-like domain